MSELTEKLRMYSDQLGGVTDEAADMIESMIPAKSLLEYLEAERKDWEGVNADRYYQTSRIIGFVKVLVSHRQGVSENARLHNEANDSERDSKLSVVVAHCEHPVVAHDRDGGATCSKCGKDLGWFCNISSKHFCEYEGDECCIHCGAPEERQ